MSALYQVVDLNTLQTVESWSKSFLVKDLTFKSKGATHRLQLYRRKTSLGGSRGRYRFGGWTQKARHGWSQCVTDSQSQLAVTLAHLDPSSDNHHIENLTPILTRVNLLSASLTCLLEPLAVCILRGAPVHRRIVWALWISCVSEFGIEARQSRPEDCRTITVC